MDTEEQLVVVRVGEGYYGLDIKNINEIVKTKSITPIPHAADFVEGLMNLRGQIVTVVNFESKLATLQDRAVNLNENSSKKAERIIVMNQAGELIGLHVDAVEKVVTVETKDLEVPNDYSVKDQGIVESVIQVNDYLVLKINIEHLLQPLSGEGRE